MEIFEALARARSALLEAIAGLDEDAMERKGVVGEWSVKNVLAHIAAWESWVVQSLPTRLETGRTPDALRARVADEDRYNAEEVAEREELTASEQLIELERTREALLEYLHGLDTATWERRGLWDTWAGTLAEYLHEAQVAHDEEHIVGLRAAAEQLRG